VVMRAGDGGRAKLNRQPYSCPWALLTVRAVSASPLARVNKKAQSSPLTRRRSHWAFRRRLEHAYPRKSGRAWDIVYDRRKLDHAKQCASLYLPLDAVNLYLALSGLLGEILFQWYSILQSICHSLVLHGKQYLCCIFLGCRQQLRGME